MLFQLVKHRILQHVTSDFQHPLKLWNLQGMDLATLREGGVAAVDKFGLLFPSLSALSLSVTSLQLNLRE